MFTSYAQVSIARIALGDLPVYVPASGLWCDAQRGWEVFDNKCYQIVRQALTWDDARYWRARVGSRLYLNHFFHASFNHVTFFHKKHLEKIKMQCVSTT